ncbi:MAG: flippase-like domain-containing protein [Micrococcales bacterium]|nr:flippase-like domain-containing protein [Micrococcales bacterium]
MSSAAPAPREATATRPSRGRQTLNAVIGLGLAAALLVWGLPYFAKTSWSDIWAVLRGIPPGTAVSLLGLMVVGLWFYTFTFTGSLPGLRHWQALVVNVCGSSVGNLLPGGGALGLAATYTILRSWGFTRRAISTSAIVTGVWNVLSRVALPVVAIIALRSGVEEDVPRALQDAAVAGAVTGVAVLGIFIAALVSEPAAQRVGRAIDRVLAPLRRRRAPSTMSVEALTLDMRARSLAIVRTGWLPMTFGMLGFFGVYYILFWFVMDAVGVEMYHGQLFAAYAIGRLLTAVGITPGGLGITENATVIALAAWGADPVAAAAGAVLFTVYTHLLEVPLGGLGWLVWTLSPKTEPPADGEDDLPGLS